MDPALEKLLFLVVDKVLLAGVGSFIAFSAAKALERYRRNQTMTMEVAKRQAVAFIDVFCGLTECAVLAAKLMAVRHEGETVTEEIDRTVKIFLAARENLETELYASRFLLRYEIGDAAWGAFEEVDSFARAVVKGASPKEIEEHAARLRKSLLPLAKHLPELHVPD